MGYFKCHDRYGGGRGKRAHKISAIFDADVNVCQVEYFAGNAALLTAYYQKRGLFKRVLVERNRVSDTGANYFKAIVLEKLYSLKWVRDSKVDKLCCACR